MTTQFNTSEIMKRAHKAARKLTAQGMNYRKALKIAMRNAWDGAKASKRNAAAMAARQNEVVATPTTTPSTPATVSATPFATATLEQAAIALGTKVWSFNGMERVYINGIKSDAKFWLEAAKGGGLKLGVKQNTESTSLMNILINEVNELVISKLA